MSQQNPYNGLESLDALQQELYEQEGVYPTVSGSDNSSLFDLVKVIVCASFFPIDVNKPDMKVVNGLIDAAFTKIVQFPLNKRPEFYHVHASFIGSQMRHELARLYWTLKQVREKVQQEQQRDVLAAAEAHVQTLNVVRHSALELHALLHTMPPELDRDVRALTSFLLEEIMEDHENCLDVVNKRKTVIIIDDPRGYVQYAVVEGDQSAFDCMTLDTVTMYEEQTPYCQALYNLLWDSYNGRLLNAHRQFPHQEVLRGARVITVTHE